jgi:hypothetical protein
MARVVLVGAALLLALGLGRWATDAGGDAVGIRSTPASSVAILPPPTVAGPPGGLGASHETTAPIGGTDGTGAAPVEGPGGPTAAPAGDVPPTAVVPVGEPPPEPHRASTEPPPTDPPTEPPPTEPPVTPPPATEPPPTAPPETAAVAPATVEAVPSGSDCNPNYDPCVPNASDVDCAGGRGNGPVYVDGPVRVIGVDVYELDGNDDDGIGCE